MDSQVDSQLLKSQSLCVLFRGMGACQMPPTPCFSYVNVLQVPPAFLLTCGRPMISSLVRHHW